ncbi:MAG: hypothetical protein IT285_05810, partial [Bdellovibrionales bacterium]|nr:hypothetical protein [Bdellovibrionales bacterium]
MSSALLDALWLSLPLVIGGGLHMMVVRGDLFPALRRPLHVPTFGAHKTWRGFAVMIAATVPGVWISAALDAPLFPESPA